LKSWRKKTENLVLCSGKSIDEDAKKLALLVHIPFVELVQAV
jgi:hypothetical protein